MPDTRRSADARRAGRAAVRMVDRQASTGGCHDRCDSRRCSLPRTTETRRHGGSLRGSCRGNHMRLTTFEEFKELAQRGTFVPVYKEIVADLLTPVSAFLKIAEHSDYAFLLESVEGGEHVGRYSFLGKDPFIILRSRDGKTVIDRGGTTTEREQPFIDTLRRLMAAFRLPFVPDLPRFTGGAV